MATPILPPPTSMIFFILFLPSRHGRPRAAMTRLGEWDEELQTAKRRKAGYDPANRRGDRRNDSAGCRYEIDRPAQGQRPRAGCVAGAQAGGGALHGAGT